ncbi:propionyl-CoA--succinate CoA transferase, partial [Acinetobacter baumannii]
TRSPNPLSKVEERIGTTAIQIDPSKIVGIVFNDTHDSPSTVTPPDYETQGIANHLIAFLEKEVAEVRLPKNLG